MKNVLLSTLLLLTSSLSLHAQTSGSRVQRMSFFSESLEVTKNFYVYLPPGYDESNDRYPVVYFLRLHENEWFLPSLHGRDGSALKDVIDTLYENSDIGKMIIVGPSTGSNDGFVPGLINMLRPDLSTSPGIGTGRFMDYFVQDLIPHIDATLRTIPNQSQRAIDGFSLGGYSSILTSFLYPGLFVSVGSYDGSIMWYNLDEPDTPGNTADDSLWINTEIAGSLFDPVFESPRNIDYMLLHSPINILLEADEAKLDSLRSIRFHISAGHTSHQTNLDRNQMLVDSMAARGIINSFDEVPLSATAVHDYGYADLHASKTLVKHWETFQLSSTTSTEEPVLEPIAQLFPNYPNPFISRTTITFSLESPTYVRLQVFDLLGREIAQLEDGFLADGVYEREWNVENFSPGIYLYRLALGNTVKTRRMTLIH